MLERVKRILLTGHHRSVSRRSDHPLQHARRMLGAVADGNGAGRVLLDLGAGSEPFRLGDLWHGRRIAVDLTSGPGLQVVADGHHLPFRDRTTDVILLMETLEHVPHPDRFLHECARVLRAGGHLCLTSPQYCMVHHYPADYYRYTDQGLRHLCKEAGLVVRDIRATGGALLVIFHAIERNLPPRVRLLFVVLTYRLFDWLDDRICGHGNHNGVQDALGWAVLAVKQ